MPKKPLDLESVVNIIVNLSARAAARKGFDLMCLIGRTTVIPKNERVRIYTNTTAMLQDGFKTTDRLYQAAQLAFSQNKKIKRLAIGVRDAAESALAAFTACREADSEWYVGVICDNLSADEHLQVMEYSNAVKPSTVYAYTTSDVSNDTTGADASIFVKAKNRNYRRSIGQFSTKHQDAVVAIMAIAMGNMTGTANSAYTLAYKTEVGVETENSTSVFSNTAVEKIKNANGNVFINRGAYYDIFEEGVMADGTWFDEIIYLDKMVNDCQLAIMDLLYSSPKLPQTEAGMTRIHAVLNEVLKDNKRIGFIAEGVWKGDSILSLKYGDTLPGGFLVQSEPINEQAQPDREARKAPPIYIALKLAGAIHHVVVQIDVNR